MEYVRDFETWEQALPFALQVAKGMAQRQPLNLDVTSLVMEALWRAQTSGAVLSRAYVRLRISGAVKDEMRHVAEGQRGNYQDGRNFVDVNDQWSLEDRSVGDVLEDIDRRRALEALPDAAQYLVRELVVVGRSQDEMADDFGVSRPAMCQVIAQLRTKPSSVVRLPGAIDLDGELRAASERYLKGVMRGDPSNQALAAKLEAPLTTVHRWAGPDRPLPKGIIAGTGGPLQAHLHEVGIGLVEKAFERSKGSVDGAAAILGCSVMTARRWWRKLPESGVDRRVRQDLSTATMLELRGQGMSFHQISKRLNCTQSAVKWRLFRAGEGGFEPLGTKNGRARYRLVSA
jgi:DNA-directed RNA polymerase specialized sigma24 family protein